MPNFPIMEDLLKLSEDRLCLGYTEDAHSPFDIRDKALKRSIELGPIQEPYQGLLLFTDIS
jgi:hypothetical protein